MSITNIYGRSGAKAVTCDSCGDGFEADSWDEADTIMREEGWKRRKIDGEWTHVCQDCREVL